MLCHVVMFRWTPTTTVADVEAITSGLAGLPPAIAEIRSYRFGSDVAVNDGTFDFVVVAEFDTTDDYLVYRDHPLHRALIADRIVPQIADRAAVQFQC